MCQADPSRPSPADELTARVQSSLRGGVHDFRLQIVNDCVVLTGWTHTYYAKQLAQECVKAETDLPLSNEIKVVEKASQTA
jgi:hypothetical protein